MCFNGDSQSSSKHGYVRYKKARNEYSRVNNKQRNIEKKVVDKAGENLKLYEFNRRKLS